MRAWDTAAPFRQAQGVAAKPVWEEPASLSARLATSVNRRTPALHIFCQPLDNSFNVTAAMDILAANDQENLVHNLQAGAAGKSLNAGLKGFNAKTPGNKAPKTPFKVPLNDENAVHKGGKSVLQTKGKGNENAFVTPAGEVQLARVSK